jgi:membrane protein
MNRRLEAVKRLGAGTIKNYSDDNVAQLAAALSYYTAFALAPLLIIVIAVVGFFFKSEAATGEIFQQIRGFIGDQGAATIQQLVKHVSEHENAGGIAAIVSIITLFFGATGVFTEIQQSLNKIFKAKPKQKSGFLKLVKDRFLSFAMVLGIGFLLLVSLILTAALTATVTYFNHLLPGTAFLWQAANFIVSFAVVVAPFGLMFKVLPDAEVSWKQAWIGSTLTAFLFTIGKTLIAIYLGKSTAASAYGAAGSLAVILIWVYYAAQILYIGAEFTYVYATSRGPVNETSAVQKRRETNYTSAGMPAGQGAPQGSY